MKFVCLLIAATVFSFSASAQARDNEMEQRTAAKVQPKGKKQKAKPSASKIASDKNEDLTTLTDEKAHKAKWTFEEMLKRRLEIDAEEGEKARRRENE